MSFDHILGMAGLLIGIIGIYVAVRRVRYRARIDFIKGQSVALFEDLAQRLPNLSVQYKGAPIDKGVVLIRGFLVNTGPADITKSMVEQNLTCRCPAGCKWLEFTVVEAASSLQFSCQIINDEVVIFDFGLLRYGEGVSFQALALFDQPLPKDKASEIADRLEWWHRIESLAPIRTVQTPQVPAKKYKRWERRIFFGIAGIIYVAGGVSIMGGVGPLKPTPSIVYKIDENGKTTLDRLIPRNDGKAIILNTKTGETQVVDLSQVEKIARFTPVLSNQPEASKFNLLTGLGLILGGFGFLAAGFWNDYRRRQIKKTIKNISKSSDLT